MGEYLTTSAQRSDMERNRWKLDAVGMNLGDANADYEVWIRDNTWTLTLLRDGTAHVQLYRSGCVVDLTAFLDVASILGLAKDQSAPPGYVLVPVEVAQGGLNTIRQLGPNCMSYSLGKLNDVLTEELAKHRAALSTTTGKER